MKEQDVAKLKVAELKEELKSRGLPLSGLKADLAKRLLEAVKTEAQESEAPAAEEVLAEKQEAPDASDAVAGDAKEEVEAPKPEVKAVESKEAETAPKEAEPAGQPDAEEVTALKGDPKGKQKGSKEGTPAAKAAPNSKADEKKAEGKQEGGKQATSSESFEEAALAAADKPGKSNSAAEGKTAKAAKKEPSDAIKNLPGDSVPAASKREQAEQQEMAKQPAKAAAAPPQILASDSAPPQVDVLGSVEVAAPLQETAEEELDYEADEVMDQASAPADTKAEAKSEETARKKRPADSEAARSSKAQKTDDAQRKREPIAFNPRGSAGAENGQREGSADLRRSGSQKEKGSVFERLHSGAGKDATTPRLAPPSREAASRALLITGFVRPFTDRAAREMLSETGEIQGFWMPKIKDRAYVVYATEEEAEATRNAVSGVEWPKGNKNSLRPKFVSLEDAERTIKTGQPPEMRMEVSATAVAPQPARAAPAAEPARPAPARLGAPVQNGPAAAAEPARRKDAREILEEKRRARDATRAPAAAPAQARPAPAAAKPQPDPEPMEEEEDPKALEDLFRKTETKPWLYWLPLTEEQIAEKAARDAAQLPGPPPKPMPQ